MFNFQCSWRGFRRAGAGAVTFDSAAIVLTDGRKVAISELGPAEEMRRGRLCRETL
jgi:hypothetical protein